MKDAPERASFSFWLTGNWGRLGLKKRFFFRGEENEVFFTIKSRLGTPELSR
jgi:hypothetical protein